MFGSSLKKDEFKFDKLLFGVVEKSESFVVYCNQDETCLSFKHKIAKVLDVGCDDSFLFWINQSEEKLDDNQLISTLSEHSCIEVQHTSYHTPRFLERSAEYLDLSFTYSNLNYDLGSILCEESKSLYICNICMEYVTKQVQCVNGHLICGVCANSIILKKGTCPTCRATLSKDILSRSLFYEQILDRENVTCPYYLEYTLKNKDQESKENPKPCDQIKYKVLVSTHKNECEFRMIKCVCSKEMMYYEYQRHKQLCPKSKYKCRYCYEAFNKEDQETHFSRDCKLIPIPCWQCGTKTNRFELNSHTEKDCLNTLIPCPYAELENGCKDLVKRRDLAAHLLEYDSHLKFVLSISASIKSLKQRIDNVLCSYYVTKQDCNPNQDWSIPNFKGNFKITGPFFEITSPFDLPHGAYEFVLSLYDKDYNLFRTFEEKLKPSRNFLNVKAWDTVHSLKFTIMKSNK
ncbi:hypothetical protein CYY_002178 [Polysphondylium violaceum]|uniref:RING-type domain-containing protein n=1 Tax=Polysphondylium violaceum TaxID=133409 RepID=A0A8J4V0Z9_9MYCE|nr:hypothetical protein CYY_002178 [Polysphondylium violaceum]